MRAGRMVEDDGGRFGFVVRTNPRTGRVTVSWRGRVQQDGVRLFDPPLISSIAGTTVRAVRTPAFDALAAIPKEDR